jgi:hypothetical protein
MVWRKRMFFLLPVKRFVGGVLSSKLRARAGAFDARAYREEHSCSCPGRATSRPSARFFGEAKTWKPRRDQLTQRRRSRAKFAFTVANLADMARPPLMSSSTDHHVIAAVDGCALDSLDRHTARTNWRAQSLNLSNQCPLKRLIYIVNIECKQLTAFS